MFFFLHSMVNVIIFMEIRLQWMGVFSFRLIMWQISRNSAAGGILCVSMHCWLKFFKATFQALSHLGCLLLAKTENLPALLYVQVQLRKAVC